KAFKKIGCFFNADLRFQQKIADRLQHLKPQYVHTFTKLVHTYHYKLHDKDLAQLLAQLGKETEGISLNALLLPEKISSRIQKYTGRALQISYTTLIGSTAFLTFTQKS